MHVQIHHIMTNMDCIYKSLLDFSLCVIKGCGFLKTILITFKKTTLKYRLLSFERIVCKEDIIYTLVKHIEFPHSLFTKITGFC